MRKLLNFGYLSMLVLAVSCGSDNILNKDNSWTRDNLRSKVKSITEVGFQAINQNGQWVKNTRNQTYSVKSYSAEGFIISERRYYSDTNELTGGFNYVYDDDGNIIRINSIDPEGNVSGFSDVQERDGKTGILRYNDFFGDATSSMATGNTEMIWKDYKLQSSIAYSITGDLMSGTTYAYDANGNVSSFSIKNYGEGQRDVVIKSTYLSFDEQNNWLSQLKEYEGYPVTEIVERRYEYYE